MPSTFIADLLLCFVSSSFERKEQCAQHVPNEDDDDGERGCKGPPAKGSEELGHQRLEELEHATLQIPTDPKFAPTLTVFWVCHMVVCTVCTKGLQPQKPSSSFNHWLTDVVPTDVSCKKFTWPGAPVASFEVSTDTENLHLQGYRLDSGTVCCTAPPLSQPHQMIDILTTVVLPFRPLRDPPSVPGASTGQGHLTSACPFSPSLS